MATAGGSVFLGRATMFSSGYLLHVTEVEDEVAAVVVGALAGALGMDALAVLETMLVVLVLPASLVELLTTVTPFITSLSPKLEMGAFALNVVVLLVVLLAEEAMEATAIRTSLKLRVTGVVWPTGRISLKTWISALSLLVLLLVVTAGELLLLLLLLFFPLLPLTLWEREAAWVTDDTRVVVLGLKVRVLILL